MLQLLRIFLFPLLFWCSGVVAQGELRGHGGPVRALSITPDGKFALSGSFDQSAIFWALETGKALRILRAHEGSVNAVLALSDRLYTAEKMGASWPGALAAMRLLSA